MRGDRPGAGSRRPGCGRPRRPGCGAGGRRCRAVPWRPRPCPPAPGRGRGPGRRRPRPGCRWSIRRALAAIPYPNRPIDDRLRCLEPGDRLAPLPGIVVHGRHQLAQESPSTVGGMDPDRGDSGHGDGRTGPAWHAGEGDVQAVDAGVAGELVAGVDHPRPIRLDLGRPQLVVGDLLGVVGQGLEERDHHRPTERRRLFGPKPPYDGIHAASLPTRGGSRHREVVLGGAAHRADRSPQKSGGGPLEAVGVDRTRHQDELVAAGRLGVGDGLAQPGR